MFEREGLSLLNPPGVKPGLLTSTGAGIRGASPGGAVQFTPTIEWFFADQGSGEVDTSNTFGASPTFTRATAGWTKLSTGLWASVASGTPRSFYGGFDTTVGTYLGYLPEGARTNSALHSRKLAAGVTATEWTESNVTAADDATGIDGVANSASTLTAGANDGTILQSRTIVSAAKTLSAFVRRKTGTGDVFITLDNDATRTDITSLINSTTYTRVTMTQTLADPTFGFKIAVSGDEIEVDMVMLEDSASFASTPIPTTTSSVTRNADVLTYPTTGWLNASAGTIFVDAQVATVATDGYLFEVNDGTTNERVTLFVSLGGGGTGRLFCADGGATQAIISAGNVSTNTSFKLTGAYAENDFAASLDGASVGTDTSGTLPTVDSADIGNRVGTSQPFGPIRRVQYFDRRLSNQHLQILTA